MISFQKEEFDCHILNEVFTAKDILDQNIQELSSSDDKEAFYVADLGNILRNHLRWCDQPSSGQVLPTSLWDESHSRARQILCRSAFTLAINIIAKKTVWKEQTSSDDKDESNEQTSMHYVNDGVHGSFNCILYDHTHVKALLPKRPKPDEKYYSSSIWGPTRDGLDWIDGFQRPSVYYVTSRLIWQLTKQIQSHGFPPEVEEQDVGTLPMSCARESGMDRHPAACASANISV
ncbi:Ornithine decarboxylase [Microtus ochrogaster]|uniref:ornithine decarboxylase n=1 Tax=Microtus ochrogaster TaxID=79684 RepID=A0A8J6GDC4_MICOH|nr:Ornithine decarboxylase [Microtus ochrogaster]